MTNSFTVAFKVCKVCNQTKPISEFAKWLKTCKDCLREIKRLKAKEYYHKHKNSPEYKAKAKAAHRRQAEMNRGLYLKKKHETYLRNKEWYNSNWHARRAIAAGASVVDRSITISKLLEKDGYVCGICNLPILKDVKNHSDKPSIDHIIPIKRGGQHTWENVRAVHCGCNNSRKNQDDGSYQVKTHFLRETLHSANQQSACQLTLSE